MLGSRARLGRAGSWSSRGLTGTAWSGDALRFYSTHALVSDGANPADHVDASLRNAWGIAFNPNGVVWVADNRTNTSTLYDGTGAKVSLGPFPEGGN